MAKKKIGTLVGGVAAIIVLGGAYFGVVKYNEYAEQKAADESEAARIYVMNLDNISSIRFGNGTDSLLFEKEDDTWYYANDTSFPVNQTILTTAEGYLQQVEASRELTEPDALSSYGLEEPSDSIYIQDGDGNQVILSIGNETGTEYYASVSGDDSVYVIDAIIPSIINYDLYHFLQMDALPSLTSSDIETITLTVGDTTNSWNKQTVEVTEEETEGDTEAETEEVGTEEPSGELDETVDETEEETEETSKEPETTEVWFDEKEQLDEESSSNVDALATAIASLSFTDCADYKGGTYLEEFGLDEPLASITWGDSEESATLYVGDTVTDEDGTIYYYVLLDGSTQVNRITSDLVEAIID